MKKEDFETSKKHFKEPSLKEKFETGFAITLIVAFAIVVVVFVIKNPPDMKGTRFQPYTPQQVEEIRRKSQERKKLEDEQKKSVEAEEQQ